jgi:hypothetical protein
MGDRAALETVRAWQDAVSAANLERAFALSAEDIEVGGPRGSGRGHQLVRDWVARTGIALEPLRVFQGGGVVVVEQRASWKLPDGSSSTQVVATVFKVEGAVVTSVVRYDSLDDALAAAGLRVDDAVT